MQGGEDIGGELGLGFEPWRVVGSENLAQPRGEAEMGAKATRRRAVFVGQDGAGDVLRSECGEQVERTGEQHGVIEHRRLHLCAEKWQHGGDMFRAGEAADGVFQTATDGGAGLGRGGGSEAKLTHRMGMTAVDRGKVIEERAIEIEENGAEAFGHRRLGG